MEQDPLTHLGNRSAYEHTLARLHEEGRTGGAIFCDVNGLKYRNDHLGHASGDELLTDMAELLRTHFRSSDCFRISGDEFVILIPQPDATVFNARASRFHAATWMMDPPIAAVGWDHGADIMEAVRNAEVRMYADKKLFYGHAKYEHLKRHDQPPF